VSHTLRWRWVALWKAQAALAPRIHAVHWGQQTFITVSLHHSCEKSHEAGELEGNSVV
jgi:hypothetical protein